MTTKKQLIEYLKLEIKILTEMIKKEPDGIGKHFLCGKLVGTKDILRYFTGEEE